MNEDLVREIGRVVFEPVRLRKGYDMGEVDRFLDDLEVEVAAGRSIRACVERAGFTPVRVREGYDMGAVDHVLDWLVGVVDARLDDPGSPSTDSAAPGSANRPEAPPTAPAAPTVAAQVSSVIKEQPGLWARIFRRNG